MLKSRPARRPEGGDASHPGAAASVDESAAPDGGVPAERFVQEGLLGRGGVGAVYLMRDRETGEQVALKKLFRMDGKSVLRLKREFRALADMRHPNLVKLYELGRGSDGWFLTMEYVPGEDLHTYLGHDERRTQTGIDAALAALTSRRSRLHDRVLPAFRQLAEGVRALHRAGFLHRDLKPNNVLVANERVVVLDFGLACELDPRAPTVTEDGQVAGTPAYMAPEQARGKELSEASDWYAFGAMLYEALTGELPFDGPIYELMRNKLELDPKPPIELDAELPADLNALCVALLARDPTARPNGNEVLACLERAIPKRAENSQTLTGETSIQTYTENRPGAAPLYGRQPQMEALFAAKRRVEQNRTVVAHVRGVSGAGKSALVEAFLDQVEQTHSPSAQPDALVLRSRCYEREAMPFKALDGVIDALSRHLSHVDDLEVSNLLPSDIGALSQLFPVLERLRAVQRLTMRRPREGDALNNRQRAELALRELFGRLASRRPLVIWIDDLQWGDLDSAAILKGWIERAPDQPIMIVFSYRADEVETSDCLRLLLGGTVDAGASTVLVDLPPLAAGDVQALCSERLGRQSAVVEGIVRESQGSPFLAAQLAALAEAKLARGDTDVEALSIGSLVTQTNALLSADAQHLLAVLAVAGRPILPKLALRATGVRHGSRDLIHALRRLQLVRTRDVAGERLLEVYHDRVREAVQRQLSPEQSQQIHAALLGALEYSGRADPDWLHTLALGANDRVAALKYGLSAAERATTALAFERAAELYARCLELSEDDAAHRGELLRNLAAAHGWCGRGGPAAEAYLAAAELATGPEALQLMRQATSHLLRTGRFEQGEAMLQRVLAAMDVRLPSTAAGMKRAIVWERMRAAVRGRGYTLRSEAEVPAALLARFDTLDALRLDTVSIEPLRAALLLERQLGLALEAGEPMRLLQVFGGICYREAIGGTARAERRADELLAEMAKLSTQIGTPRARVHECVIRALVCWMMGRPKEVLAPSEEAEALLRRLAPSEADYYLRRAMSSARIGALYELRNYRAFAAELEVELQQARATDNRAAVLQLALNETVLDELLGRSEVAFERLKLQRTQLPPVEFSTYHALHMISVCHAAVISGNYAWGLAILSEDWPRFLRSPISGAANLAWYARLERTHVLVSSHLVEGQPASREIAREIEAIDRAGLRGHRAAQGFRGRIARAAGHDAKAIELLQEANERDGPYDPELARYVTGCILGGEEGAAIRARSEAAMREHGVVDVPIYVRARYPELYSSRGR